MPGRRQDGQGVDDPDETEFGGPPHPSVITYTGLLRTEGLAKQVLGTAAVDGPGPAYHPAAAPATPKFSFGGEGVDRSMPTTTTPGPGAFQAAAGAMEKQQLSTRASAPAPRISRATEEVERKARFIGGGLDGHALGTEGPGPAYALPSEFDSQQPQHRRTRNPRGPTGGRDKQSFSDRWRAKISRIKPVPKEKFASDGPGPATADVGKPTRTSLGLQKESRLISQPRVTIGRAPKSQGHKLFAGPGLDASGRVPPGGDVDGPGVARNVVRDWSRDRDGSAAFTFGGTKTQRKLPGQLLRPKSTPSIPHAHGSYRARRTASSRHGSRRTAQMKRHDYSWLHDEDVATDLSHRRDIPQSADRRRTRPGRRPRSAIAGARYTPELTGCEKPPAKALPRPKSASFGRGERFHPGEYTPQQPGGAIGLGGDTPGPSFFPTTVRATPAFSFPTTTHLDLTPRTREKLIVPGPGAYSTTEDEFAADLRDRLLKELSEVLQQPNFGLRQSIAISEDGDELSEFGEASTTSLQNVPTLLPDSSTPTGVGGTVESGDTGSHKATNELDAVLDMAAEWGKASASSDAASLHFDEQHSAHNANETSWQIDVDRAKPNETDAWTAEPQSAIRGAAQAFVLDSVAAAPSSLRGVSVDSRLDVDCPTVSTGTEERLGTRQRGPAASPPAGMHRLGLTSRTPGGEGGEQQAVAVDRHESIVSHEQEGLTSDDSVGIAPDDAHWGEPYAPVLLPTSGKVGASQHISTTESAPTTLLAVHEKRNAQLRPQTAVARSSRVTGEQRTMSRALLTLRSGRELSSVPVDRNGRPATAGAALRATEHRLGQYSAQSVAATEHAVLRRAQSVQARIRASVGRGVTRPSSAAASFGSEEQRPPPGKLYTGPIEAAERHGVDSPGPTTTPISVAGDATPAWSFAGQGCKDIGGVTKRDIITTEEAAPVKSTLGPQPLSHRRSAPSIAFARGTRPPFTAAGVHTEIVGVTSETDPTLPRPKAVSKRSSERFPEQPVTPGPGDYRTEIGSWAAVTKGVIHMQTRFRKREPRRARERKVNQAEIHRPGQRRKRVLRSVIEEDRKREAQRRVGAQTAPG